MARTDKPADVQPEIKVRATRRGYYDEVLRHPGDVFLLHKPSTEFSERWMEKVDPRTPVRASGPQSTIPRGSPLSAQDQPGILTGDDGDTAATGDRDPLK